MVGGRGAKRERAGASARVGVVAVVMPAFFRTNIIANGRGPARMQEAAGKLIERSGIEASEVAEAILMAASRDRTHFVYPPKYRGIWWLKRFAPQRWHQIFPRLFKR